MTFLRLMTYENYWVDRNLSLSRNSLFLKVKAGGLWRPAAHGPLRLQSHFLGAPATWNEDL